MLYIYNYIGMEIQMTKTISEGHEIRQLAPVEFIDYQLVVSNIETQS